MGFFPEVAPFHGPSSSEKGNQNQLGFLESISLLDELLGQFGYVTDPSEADYLAPVVPLLPTLWIGIASASYCSAPTFYEVGPQNIFVPPNSQCLIYALPIGNGGGTDFPGESNPALPSVPQSASLTAQSNGSWLINPALGGDESNTLLFAQSAVDLQDGLPLTETFTSVFYPGNSHGPAFFDVNGNGFALEFSENTSTLVQLASGMLLNEYRILGAIPGGEDGVTHSYTFQIAYVGLGASQGFYTYELDLWIDGQKYHKFHKFVTKEVQIAPNSIYPGYFNNGGQVTLYSWNWVKNSLPISGWQCYPFLSSSPEGGVKFFYVSTNETMVQDIQDFYEESTLSTQIAYLRESIELLQGAYN